MSPRSKSSSAATVANPCQPPFLGSMTSLCKAGVWGPIVPMGKLLRVLIPLIDLWCFFLLNAGGAFFMAMFFGICVTSILEYLDVVSKHLTRSPSPRLRLMPCIRLYRKIWIVERMLNAIFSAALLPIMLLNWTSVQIFAGFVTISRHSVVQMPQYLMFPIVWWNCIALNLSVTTLSSYIYGNSGRIMGQLGKLRCQLRFRFGRKLAHRELRSCTPLKIKFGNNFIDGMTPIVNQDLAWNQTMSLMLLGKS
ncbi:hypothetical protein Fcan01_16026 [Folsomia candida]|uniref:Uncharacterized protein n=1 Tax=Folsomia candida TaxID=158441 RepID=A0A226DWN3_FOLCA|nr:hypothetical protein Fcan01_16026 [Folsomia candida]